MAPQIYLVTGASKSLGLAITHSLLLASPPGSTVYLTARSQPAGEAAVSSVKSTLSSDACQSSLSFLQLDVNSPASVAAAANAVRNRHGRLDVLVSNAGVEFGLVGRKNGMTRTEEVQRTLSTNYFGVLDLCDKFLPLIPRDGTGRIVLVSSTASHLRFVYSDQLRQRLTADDLAVPELTKMMEDFAAARDGVGFGTAYTASKAAQNAFTRILARENPQIKVNSCCPGWVDTEMGRHAGPNPPKTCGNPLPPLHLEWDAKGAQRRVRGYRCGWPWATLAMCPASSGRTRRCRTPSTGRWQCGDGFPTICSYDDWSLVICVSCIDVIVDVPKSETWIAPLLHSASVCTSGR